LPQGFDAHYKHVRKATAARGTEVLEFQVQEGWEPLCKFLGKDIPKEPFPHINEGNSVIFMNKMMLMARTMAITKRGIKYVVLPLAVTGAALWWLKERFI
jgi:Sulfotransferase domain